MIWIPLLILVGLVLTIVFALGLWVGSASGRAREARRNRDELAELLMDDQAWAQRRLQRSGKVVQFPGEYENPAPRRER